MNGQQIYEKSLIIRLNKNLLEIGTLIIRETQTQ
jgi:hypothetical protein